MPAALKTLISQRATTLSSAALFAVITALPNETAVTFPFSTDATEVSELSQTRSLSVVVSGRNEAVRVDDSPSVSVMLCALSVIDFGFCVTVTMQVALFPPSSVFAVMVAVPTPFAVTVPPSSTTATFLSLVDQLTLLYVASCGKTCALSVNASPFSIASSVRSSVTCVVFLLTLTLQLAFSPLSFIVTVIIAVPTAFPVIFPFSTVATASLSDVHFTEESVTSSGE